jgi:hypothetical protein
MRREIGAMAMAAAMVGGVVLERETEATFTGFVVTSAVLTNSGQSLRVYTVYARFNGPTDTLIRAFNLGSTNGTPSLTGFWHKDNASYNSGVLSQEFGTWNPSQTGSNTANRPFDSYLTVGGVASSTNTTNAESSWTFGGNADARGWNRPDLPNNGTLAWFSDLPNLQGRVGIAPNTATDVRVGQFVLSASDTAARILTLTIGYNDGLPGTGGQFATSTFTLACPSVYRDLDGDGFGATSSGTLKTCIAVAGYVTNDTDCNDANPAINPNTIWYADVDGDGFGSASGGTVTQCLQPTGFVLNNSDNCPSIANPGQQDCNANTIGDACDIASGLSLDCDSDSEPDECEGASVIALASPLMNFGGAQVAQQTFTGLVPAYGQQPVVTIEAKADLGDPADGVLVSIDGGMPQLFFVTDGTDCPASPNVATISLPIAGFNTLTADGALTVRVTPFGAVSSASCVDGGVRVKLGYFGLPSASDCNGNGRLDSCDIGTDADADCNANGKPDSCDLASGSATDCNGNGRLDSCDLALGSSTDLDGNGVLDDCAGEWIVGGSGFATIQAAVNAAPSGATVRVGAGVHGPFDLSGKAITVQSLGGSANTIIDGAGAQRCVSMTTPASGATVLIGFTIRNGSALDGAGVRVIGSSLSLRDSVVRANVAGGSGGGIAVTNGALTVVNCVIEHNSADRGGGVYVERAGAPSSAVIRDTVVASNDSVQPGGGVHNRGQLTLQRATVSMNTAASGAGGLWSNPGPGVVSLLSDSVFCMNSPENIAGAYEDDPDAPASRFGQDCDGNGVCDALETVPDCNANGSPDACDIADGTSLDCNENGVPDSCDIALGTSTDVDANGIPDDCKPDCDGDGLPDAWELAQGLDVDCNGNATLDRCEIAQAPGLDCDGDQQLDACEIAATPSIDCDGDGSIDACEIAANPGLDKNANGRLDWCELRRGDLNLDGIVNAADLAVLLALWNVPQAPVGDLNGDGAVGAADLAIMLGNWGSVV